MASRARAAAMDQGDLVFKVMRLRRPQAEPPSAMVADAGADLPRLLLPMSLTQTLVGEPFKGYLHLLNNRAVAVKNVALRVELQVGASRYVLFNNATMPVAHLEPGDFFDADVEHELRDPGTYVLTCNVSYHVANRVATDGQPLQPTLFKRSYRFPAQQPFAVQQRVAQVDTKLLVECGIENSTSAGIHLTSAKLDCKDGLEAQLVGGGPSDGPFACDGLLRPQGTHSLIFEVKASSLSGAAGAAALRELDVVGNLALGWRVPDGPSGCADCHEVRVKPCGVPPMDLRVKSCPRQVRVEEPFELELEVVNRAHRVAEPAVVMDLRLMGGVKVHGATKHAVGRLEPGCAGSVPVRLFVSTPGMHVLQGVSLVDELSGLRTECAALCDLLAF